MDSQEISSLKNKNQELLEYFAQSIFQQKITKKNNLHPKASHRIQKLLEIKVLKASLKRGKFIGIEGSKKISEALKLLKSLKTLNLIISSSAQIQDEGLVNIFNSIKSLEQLESFKVLICPDNTLKHQGMIELSSSIKKLINLNRLSIKVYSNPISKEGFHQLINAISHNKSLKYLNLEFLNNQLQEESLIFLGNSLKNSIQIENFTLIIQKQQEISSEVIKELNHAVKQLQNLKGLKLQVQLDEITEQLTLDCFVDLQNLESLKIFIPNFPSNINERLDKQQLFQHLKIVNLTFTKYQSTSQIEVISNTLHHFKLMTELTIHFQDSSKQENKITAKQIHILIEGLQKCQNLVKLNIQTHLEFDFLYLSLLHNLTELEILQLNHVSKSQISFKRDSQSKRITELDIPIYPTLKHKEYQQLHYLSEALGKIQNLQRIFLNIFKLYHLPSIEVVAQQNTEALSEVIKNNITAFLKNVQQLKNINFFQINLIQSQNYQIENDIKVQRQQNGNDFSVDISLKGEYYDQYKHLDMNLKIIGLVLNSLNLNVDHLGINITNLLFLNDRLTNLLVEPFSQLQNLKAAIVTFKSYTYVKNEQKINQLFVGLKKLQYLQMNSQNRRNYQLLRKNIRQVIFKY